MLIAALLYYGIGVWIVIAALGTMTPEEQEFPQKNPLSAMIIMAIIAAIAPLMFVYGLVKRFFLGESK